MRRDEIKGYGEHVLSGGIGMVAPLMKEGERRSPPPFVQYRVVQKKGTVLLSTSLAWPAVAGCSRAETFSQLSSNKFTPLCRHLSLSKTETQISNFPLSLPLCAVCSLCKSAIQQFTSYAATLPLVLRPVVLEREWEDNY